MILISKTYSEITPESAEDGEFSDSGFVFEDAECTFRELVDYLKEHKGSSCYPCKGEISEYFSSGFSVDDYQTGTETGTSIHYSRKNPSRKDKYWKLAVKAAGLC